jgi:hypothetical protein
VSAIKDLQRMRMKPTEYELTNKLHGKYLCIKWSIIIFYYYDRRFFETSVIIDSNTCSISANMTSFNVCVMYVSSANKTCLSAQSSACILMIRA